MQLLEQSKSIPCFFIFLLCLSFNCYSKTVYIISLSFPTNEKLFNPGERDGCMYPFIALQSALQDLGYTCSCLPENYKDDELDKDRWFIVIEVPVSKKIVTLIAENPQERNILLMFEPPAVLPHNYNSSLHKPFKAIFTLMHEMVDNIRYFPLFFPQPFLFVMENSVPYKKRKLCTLIASDKQYNHPQELYSQRRAIIRFFEKHAKKNFDFYGIGWDGSKHRCYRGAISSKLSYLQQYKFAICYENMITRTYITEKIFDIMHAGCVPVYWGAQEISKYIPPNVYIRREHFSSDKSLYRYLRSMSKKEHDAYLQAARDFFISKNAEKFSMKYFVQTIITALFD